MSVSVGMLDAAVFDAVIQEEIRVQQEVLDELPGPTASAKATASARQLILPLDIPVGVRRRPAVG
jgi:hypothetical protein